MAEDLKEKKDKRLVDAIAVEYLCHSGKWVELISIPVEDDVYEDDEDVKSSLNTLHSLLYKAEKAELKIPNMFLCLRGIDTGAIFRTFVKYKSFKHIHNNGDIKIEV